MPLEHAKQANRMSAAGMPLFYGAETSNTAVREVASCAARFVGSAPFTTSRSCVVVDLTTSPVGVLDPVRGQDWRVYRFLNRFAEAPSQKIEPGDVHIDYVPTQIVTEYLLKILRDIHGRAIDGLVHSSSITGGRCVVLDVPNEACLMRGDPVSQDRLQMTFDEQRVDTMEVEHALNIGREAPPA